MKKMFSIAVLLLLITTAAAFAQKLPSVERVGTQLILNVSEQPTKQTVYPNNDLAVLSDGNIYYFITYGKDITMWVQKNNHAPKHIATMPGKTSTTPIRTMLAFVMDKSDIKNSKPDLYSKN
jgi:uncharacterized protein YgiM (DUF1202 family)